MSFNENSDESEDENQNGAENGQDDIEAMKASIKTQQRKLSDAQKRARKAEKSKTKPVNHPKIRDPNICCTSKLIKLSLMKQFL